MPAIRLSGARSLMEEYISPGDTMLLGDSATAGATAVVGAATLSAAALTSGYIYRSGSTAAYTDTFDTAANVLAALAGNSPNGPIIVGHSFKLRITNSVAYAQTINLGTGMAAGNGSLSVAASTWRDYLFTIQSVQAPLQVNCNTTNGSPTVTYVLPTGQVSLQVGPAVTATNIMPGASITGSGIPANTTVLGVNYGQGGAIGLTLSANATATASNVALAVGPSIRVDSSGSGTL